MTIRFLFILLSVFITGSVFSQTDTILRVVGPRYLPVPLKVSASKLDSIVITSIINKTADGSWSVEDLHPLTGKIMVKANYLDNNFTKPVGPYSTYFPNGQLKTSGSYLNNRKSGNWKEWFDNGTLKDSLVYDNNNGNITGTRKKWYTDGKLSDSTEYQADGHGYSVNWDGRGVKRGEGPRINHERDGEWKFFRMSGELITRETYIKDSLVAIRCFEMDGTPSKGECIAEKHAEFPKGMDGWHRYITKKVESNKRQLIKNSANGTVYVSFIIGSDGKIEEPKIENPKGGYFEEFALSVIRDAPQWIPAIQHNQHVRTYMKQPISFLYE